MSSSAPFNGQIEASQGCVESSWAAAPSSRRLRLLAGDDGVVQVVGQRLDVPDILNAADVLCLSSRAEGVRW